MTEEKTSLSQESRWEFGWIISVLVMYEPPLGRVRPEQNKEPLKIIKRNDFFKGIILL